MDGRFDGGRVIAGEWNPQPGEVWKVRLDPTEGQELQKTRLGIVVGLPAAMRLSIRLVVLMSAWHDKHAAYPWRLRLDASKTNGLEKSVAVQPEQTRCLAVARFVEPMGKLSATEYDEVKGALALFLDLD